MTNPAKTRAKFARWTVGLMGWLRCDGQMVAQVFDGLAKPLAKELNAKRITLPARKGRAK